MQIKLAWSCSKSFASRGCIAGHGAGMDGGSGNDEILARVRNVVARTGPFDPATATHRFTIGGVDPLSAATRRFGVTGIAPPLALPRFRISAVAPKVALMDAGVAWLFDALRDAAAEGAGNEVRRRRVAD